MPHVEVSLPDQTETEIDRLVDQGEFLNREQAIEELLSMGVSAYRTTDDSATQEDDFFDGTPNDQQDPARRDDPDDEYTL